MNTVNANLLNTYESFSVIGANRCQQSGDQAEDTRVPCGSERPTGTSKLPGPRMRTPLPKVLIPTP